MHSKFNSAVGGIDKVLVIKGSISLNNIGNHSSTDEGLEVFLLGFRMRRIKVFFPNGGTSGEKEIRCIRVVFRLVSVLRAFRMCMRRASGFCD